MAYEAYAKKAEYLREYNTIPEDEIEKRLKLASRHIDSLTFNRILGQGFNSLTEFQREIITEVCCDMAQFEYENEDMINSIFQQYSINGVTMSFGNSWNVMLQNGIAIKRDVYEKLCQTGLCCRRVR